MNKLLSSLILISLAGLASANEPQQQQQQQQQLLGKMRALESRSHMERIMILQKAEGCIQTAKSLPDFHNCEQKERAAREQLREELHAKQEALREQAHQMRNPPQAALQAKP